MHSFFPIFSMIILVAGQIWLAWDIYEQEGLLWSLLVLLIPFPLFALWAWYRKGWGKEYLPAGILYISGYCLFFLSGAYKLIR